MKPKFSEFLLLFTFIAFFYLSGCKKHQTKEIIQPVKIDGKARFIIGNYYNPRDLNELKNFAANGFNLVRCAPGKEALDLVRQAGLYGWVNTGSSIDFTADKDIRKAKLAELINRLKDHPALAVWEVPDEALWAISYPQLDRLFYSKKWTKARQDSVLQVLNETIKQKAQGYAEGCAELRRLDPLHPIWMNHAPRNSTAHLRLFSQAADIIGCDIYPEREGFTGHSELTDQSLTATGGYTDLMQAAAPRKPVWMVLQAFSWELLQNPLPEKFDVKQFPSYKHSRIMAWDAILHGAKGILYWGSYKVSTKTLFWKSILGVTKEIAALEPFLIAPDAPEKVKIDPLQYTHSIKTRVAYMLKHYKNDYLLAVLQEDLGQALDISGLDFLEGKTLYELTTDRSYVVKNGSIRLWFAKEPHVLCTSRKYDVVHESQFPLVWDETDNYPLKEIE